MTEFVEHSFFNSSFPASAENTTVRWADHVNSHVISVTLEQRTVMSLFLTDDDARALHEALGVSLKVRATQLDQLAQDSAVQS